MVSTMIMDDHEILYRYKEAADPKQQIEILADLNACSVWEMQEKLIALGADVDKRWFKSQNPAKKKKGEKAIAEDERVAWQNQLDELGGRLNDLDMRLLLERKHVQDRDARIVELNARIEDLETALREKDKQVERLQAELLAMQKARPVTDVNEAVVLAAFLRGASGLDAYRWGLLLDAIWQARFSGADPRDVAEEIYLSVKKEDHDAA